MKINPSLGELGVLLEPASVVAKAWEHVERIGARAAWRPQRALVTGAGPIGLLAALLGVQRGLISDATVEQALLALLSEITQLPPDEIKAKYADQPEDWFSPIADVEEEVLASYSARLAQFPAISARKRFTRSYLQPELAPHVTGFVGFIPPERLEEFRARGYAGDERIGLNPSPQRDGLRGPQRWRRARYRFVGDDIHDAAVRNPRRDDAAGVGTLARRRGRIDRNHDALQRRSFPHATTF